MSKVVEIWCDGGCRGNGKANSIGGWGVFLSYDNKTKEIYGGQRDTTNNVMELTGAIEALESLKTKRIPVRIHCDSAYVINGINEWVVGWKRRGWKKPDKKTPENVELWKRLDELKNSFDDIEFVKVKGHADNAGNIRADELANIAMDEVQAND